MSRKFTRQQLYDMVWERAVSKVAPELGISDVALRKQCIKHVIPLPDATYWGRLHAGRKPPRVPLKPAPDGVADMVFIRTRQRPEPPAEVAKAIEVARAAPTVVTVPEALHPLVATTMSRAKKADLDQRGAVTNLGLDFFQLRAHPTTLERVGTFLNILARSALARGHSFAPGRDGLDMVVDGEAIGFIVIQTIRRSLHKETEEERRRLERWNARHRRDDWTNWRDRPSIPYWDFNPSGEMSIEINGWGRYDGAQQRFADTRLRKIEARIDDILVSFAAYAAGRKVDRAEAAERQRLAEIERQHRAEEARLAKLEKDRVEYLDKKLAQARARDELKALLSGLSPSGPQDSPAYARFIAWAEQRLASAEQLLSTAVIEEEVSNMDAFATAGR